VGQGLKLNDPFHLRTSRVSWKNEITRPGDAYERFPTVYDGARAGILNLLNKQRLHGLDTPLEIVSAVSPPNENPTLAMAKQVAKDCGAGSAEARIDMEQPATLQCVAATLWRWENSGIPVDLGMIARIVAELLGLSV
jgi:hypothetical protein